MYNDTITLFNAYKDKTKAVHWYPSVLHNVKRNMDKAAIIAKYGAESQDKAVLNVRYQIVDGNKMIGDKKWLPPKEWSRQATEFLADSITFADGQNFDFFYVGDWGSEEPIADDAYGVDGFYNYMNKQYDYVFAVSSVGGPYSVIPHFEILGK